MIRAPCSSGWISSRGRKLFARSARRGSTQPALLAPSAAIRLAYCWAHARRKLVEITRTGSTPIAEDGVKRIGELYRIEAELRGLDADARLAGRQTRSAPLIADLLTWLTHHRARVAGKSPLGEALASAYS